MNDIINLMLILILINVSQVTYDVYEKLNYTYNLDINSIGIYIIEKYKIITGVLLIIYIINYLFGYNEILTFLLFINIFFKLVYLKKIIILLKSK